jgi:three-Cys-motif partner protein
MARQKFGGTHTEHKLAALKKYLNAYTTALQKQPFKLAFFDAFAGTGEIELPKSSTPLFAGADAQTFIDGSARLALQCDPKFDKYVLLEKAASKARSLGNLRHEHADIADRIEIICGEANDQLQLFCRNRD